MCMHHHETVKEHAECPENKAMLERRHIVQVLAAGGVLTATAPALSGCATNPVTGKKQLLLVGDSSLSQMAAASWAEAKKKTPVSTDPRYNNRLRQIGSRISRGSGRANEKWDYAVFDTDTKNAFVLPGNRVGFYKGMMDFADNDDQVAAIMGHEVGHVDGKHAAERVSQGMLGQAVVGVGSVVGATQLSKKCKQYRMRDQYNRCMQSAQRNSQLLTTALGMGFQIGVLLPFSRKHESESDKLGALYMKNAGYDVTQSVRLWEKMAANSPRTTPTWLSTHPDPADRARDLDAFIRKQDSLGSQGWKTIQI